MVCRRHCQLTLNHDVPVEASSSNNRGCRKNEKNCMGALDRRTDQKPILELRSKSHIPSLNVRVNCVHFYAHLYLPRTKYHVSTFAIEIQGGFPMARPECGSLSMAMKTFNCRSSKRVKSSTYPVDTTIVSLRCLNTVG